MEPGTDKEIHEWYKEEYSITFPIFANVNVIGFGSHLLWSYLSKSFQKSKGEININGNWVKFLISREGDIIDFFEQN